MKPNFKISVETVAEVQPSKIAEALILEVVRETGYLEAYREYGFGSAYYVELPRYINRLVEDGKQEEAHQELLACFGDNGMPDELWDRMKTG